MHRILPGLGIGGKYFADFSDTDAPALGLAQALATASWTFLPPARISTTDFGPRGICLLRSMMAPSSLTPTTALPSRWMVHRRMLLSPELGMRERAGPHHRARPGRGQAGSAGILPAHDPALRQA